MYDDMLKRIEEIMYSDNPDMPSVRTLYRACKVLGWAERNYYAQFTFPVPKENAHIIERCESFCAWADKTFPNEKFV